MAKISQFSSWLLPATARQTSKIARLCRANRIREQLEDRPMNRREASTLIYDLSIQLRRKK